MPRVVELAYVVDTGRHDHEQCQRECGESKTRAECERRQHEQQRREVERVEERLLSVNNVQCELAR